MDRDRKITWSEGYAYWDVLEEVERSLTEQYGCEPDGKLVEETTLK